MANALPMPREYRRVSSYQILQRDKYDQACVRVGSNVQIFKTGGPYTIGDAHDVYVGDVWVMAGQSNMRGWGNLRDVPEATVPPLAPVEGLHCYQSNDEWAVAKDPLHNLAISKRKIHKLLPDPTNGGARTPTAPPDSTDPWIPNKGAGLGMAFAIEYKNTLNVPVGLVPCAHGGTTMAQWYPDRSNRDEESLYGALIDRCIKLVSGVAGVLWFQGESDAIEIANIPHHEAQLSLLIQALRTDLMNDNLPIVYSQIGRCVGSKFPVGWSMIRQCQLNLLRRELTNVGMVASIDTDLDDHVHISAEGLRTIGRRMSKVATAIIGQRKWCGPKHCALLKQIDVEQIQFEHNQDAAGSLRIYVVLQFNHVVEWKKNRAFGFTFVGSENKQLDFIHKVTFENRNHIRLHLTPNSTYYDEGPISLYYGFGSNPICTVVDIDDMALPGFGPIDIELKPGNSYTHF